MLTTVIKGKIEKSNQQAKLTAQLLGTTINLLYWKKKNLYNLDMLEKRGFKK